MMLLGILCADMWKPLHCLLSLRQSMPKPYLLGVGPAIRAFSASSLCNKYQKFCNGHIKVVAMVCSERKGILVNS
jgi:hypothetical protein